MPTGNVKSILDRGEYSQFKTLSDFSAKEEDMFIYCQHLDGHILNMNIPGWVLDPFGNADTAESSNLEDELLELPTNEELKIKFRNGYQKFFLQKTIPALYPGLWARAQ